MDIILQSLTKVVGVKSKKKNTPLKCRNFVNFNVCLLKIPLLGLQGWSLSQLMIRSHIPMLVTLVVVAALLFETIIH